MVLQDRHLGEICYFLYSRKDRMTYHHPSPDNFPGPGFGGGPWGDPSVTSAVEKLRRTEEVLGPDGVHTSYAGLLDPEAAAATTRGRGEMPDTGFMPRVPAQAPSPEPMPQIAVPIVPGRRPLTDTQELPAVPREPRGEAGNDETEQRAWDWIGGRPIRSHREAAKWPKRLVWAGIAAGSALTAATVVWEHWPR